MGSAERSDFVIALVELHVVSRIKVASLATARPHAYQYACSGSAEKSMRDSCVTCWLPRVCMIAQRRGEPTRLRGEECQDLAKKHIHSLSRVFALGHNEPGQHCQPGWCASPKWCLVVYSA